MVSGWVWLADVVRFGGNSAADYREVALEGAEERVVSNLTHGFGENDEIGAADYREVPLEELVEVHA